MRTNINTAAGMRHVRQDEGEGRSRDTGHLITLENIIKSIHMYLRLHCYSPVAGCCSAIGSAGASLEPHHSPKHIICYSNLSLVYCCSPHIGCCSATGSRGCFSSTVHLAPPPSHRLLQRGNAEEEHGVEEEAQDAGAHEQLGPVPHEARVRVQVADRLAQALHEAEEAQDAGPTLALGGGEEGRGGGEEET